MCVWGKNVPGRGTSKCKGPEGAASVGCLRHCTVCGEVGSEGRELSGTSVTQGLVGQGGDPAFRSERGRKAFEGLSRRVT